jgi:hypothetical protein
VDPADQFDTGDNDLRRPEPFESQHWTDAKFHATVEQVAGEFFALDAGDDGDA